MSKATEGSELQPFRADLPQADLDDLQARLTQVRWPDELPGNGVALRSSARVRPRAGRALAHGLRLARPGDQAQCPAPIRRPTIDGQSVHFIHVSSPEPDALALICTHGWPMSVFEYLDLIGPLSDPRAHGDDPADAFHLVIPSLPGVAFSGPTAGPGWDTQRIARAWVELMARLGYERYGAHGNDAGSLISPEVGRHDAERVVGVHVTQLFSFPSGDPAEFADMSEEDQAAMQFLEQFTAARRPRLQRLSVRPTADAGLRAAGLTRRLAGLGDPALPALARAGRHPDSRLRLLADQHDRLVHPPLLRGHPRQPATDTSPPPPRPALRSSPRTSSQCGASPSATTPTSSAGTATTAAATSHPRTPPTSYSTTSAASSAGCAEADGPKQLRGGRASRLDVVSGRPRPCSPRRGARRWRG